MGPRAGLDRRKSCTHRDLIPDHPACNQSLYQLSYPAHTWSQETLIIYLFYIHSIIIYGILWDNLPCSIKIFRIKKNIRRIITNSRVGIPSEIYLKDENVTFIFTTHIILSLYKVNYKHLYIAEMEIHNFNAR